MAGNGPGAFRRPCRRSTKSCSKAPHLQIALGKGRTLHQHVSLEEKISMIHAVFEAHIESERFLQVYRIVILG